MAYLVMLVTVLAIMHGVVHPYPRRSTNQQTKSNLVCKVYYKPDAPLGSNKILYMNCEEPGPKEIPESRGSEVSIQNEMKVEAKPKRGPYNKKWRLPRIENEEFQTVFIIGTDDY